MLEKNVKRIIIIIVVIILLIGIGGTVLYFTTDLLKSEDVLFKKYISQNIKNIVNVMDFSEEENNINSLLNNNYTENTDITIKYLKSENDEEELYSIKEEGIINNENKASYRNTIAKFNDETLINIENLRENDTFGFRLSNLVQQFVNVKNASVAYFVASLGEDARYFPEKFNFDDINVKGIFDFSDEEIKEIRDRYLKIIFEDIDTKNYSSKSNSIITLCNGESVTTKVYILTLNKNELDKIYKRTLTQLSNEKIILAKLDKIDEEIKKIGFNEPEGSSLRERYIAKVQKIADSIEYEGEDNREITFSVYEKKGNTVRTSMKTDEYEYIIDFDNKNIQTISLKSIKFTEEGTAEKLYEIGKQKNENGNNRIIKYKNNNTTLEINLNLENSDNNVNLKTNTNYKSDDIYNIDIDSNTNIDMGKKETIPTTFEENKVILLNDYEDGDRIKSIFNQLKIRLIKHLENTQSKINTKLLNNIINMINLEEEKLAKELQENTEAQKQSFNNQFEFYKGEDLNYNHIQKLINIIGNNMTDYEIIDGKKIRFYIKQNQKNKEKSDQVKNAITDAHTYNVGINYSEDGYIESIDISIYKKQ